MKVKDICSLQNGRAFKPDDWGAEGLPIIRIQNLNDEEAPFNYYAGEYNPVHEVNDGELLFSWSGTPGTSFGAFRWYRGKGVLNQHIFRVIPKTNIDKEYLKYALNGNITTIISKAHGGVGLQHITKKELDEIEITVVSEQKQKDIVAVLHRVEKVITLRKKELKELDDLIKARFVELFGSGRDGKCNAVMISDICKFQQGTQIPVELQKVEYKEGYKRFLRIIDYTQAPQPPRFVNVEGKEIDDKSVVVVRYGATAGFVGRGYSGILANNLFEVVPDESIISKAFLYLALKYGTFERDIHEKAFGAAMPALSFSMLNDIPIVVPNLLSQELFVRFYEQVDKSKFALNVIRQLNAYNYI